MNLLGASDRRAVEQRLAPCPRCRVVHDTEGQLGEHLMREHLMGESRARREAHEAATGIRRDADGECVGCKRAKDAGHTPYCYIAKRAERMGYRLEPVRWDGRVLA
jgi:Zn-finger nucleic acid-binding protein